MNKNLQQIKAIFLFAVLLCAAVGLAARFGSQTETLAAQKLETDAVAFEEIKEIRGYKNWTKVNPKPLKLPAPLDALCRMPTGRDLLDTSQNPHRQQKYFTVYVNETGRQAMMTEKAPVFAEGSVIVKEKLLTASGTSKPELLTVMIKQKKGFDPETGDWEYMVVGSEGTKIEGRGRLENCQSCHVLNKQTDYVFRNYLPDEVKNKLK